MSLRSPARSAIIWMGPACQSGALTPLRPRRRTRLTWYHSPPGGGLGPVPRLHLVTRQGSHSWNENGKGTDSVPLAERLFPPCQSQPDILSPVPVEDNGSLDKPHSGPSPDPSLHSPGFKNVVLAFSKVNTLLKVNTALPQPRCPARPLRIWKAAPGWEPGRSPGPDSPGRWRSAGVPGCPATTCWKEALVRAAREASGRHAGAAQPRRGLQPRSPRRVPGRSSRPRPLICQGSRGQSRTTGRGVLQHPGAALVPSPSDSFWRLPRCSLTICGIFSQLLTHSEVHKDLP